jgi:hypothetical protein
MPTILCPTYEHIDQIRSLNSKHLINHLTEAQKQNGFIKIEYNRDDLKQIIANKEIVIATNNNIVIGYYLIGNSASKTEHEIHRRLIKSLSNKFNVQIEKFGYGLQVVIDDKYRDFYTFKLMFKKLLDVNNSKYSYLIGYISDENEKSKRIHNLIGFNKVDFNTEFKGEFLIIAT